MLITRGYWPPFWRCVSPAEDRAFVHCRHLMTVILNTHRMLSRFCLHSYQNEVLGGPHLSITAGLQLFASLWPGFNSRAYKLSLNSVEQGPFNPLLSLSPDKCSSAASPRHMPPSYLLLSAIRWPCFAFSHGSLWAALSPRLLEAQHQTGGYITLTVMVCIQTAKCIFPLWLWTGIIMQNLCTVFSVEPLLHPLQMIWMEACLYIFSDVVGLPRKKNLLYDEKMWNFHQFDTFNSQECFDFTWQKICQF